MYRCSVYLERHYVAARETGKDRPKKYQGKERLIRKLHLTEDAVNMTFERRWQNRAGVEAFMLLERLRSVELDKSYRVETMESGPLQTWEDGRVSYTVYLFYAEK